MPNEKQGPIGLDDLNAVATIHDFDELGRLSLEKTRRQKAMDFDLQRVDWFVKMFAQKNLVAKLRQNQYS